MEERTGLVTFGGNPMTLVGPELKVGDDAPDAEVVGNDLGFGPAEFGQVLDCLEKRTVGRGSLEVADMLARRHPGAGGQADRVLQLPADGEDRRYSRHRKPHRPRDVAA